MLKKCWAVAGRKRSSSQQLVVGMLQSWITFSQWVHALNKKNEGKITIKKVKLQFTSDIDVSTVLY